MPDIPSGPTLNDTFRNHIDAAKSSLDDAIAITQAANNIASGPTPDSGKAHVLSKILSAMHDARALLVKPSGPLSEPLDD